MRNHALRASLAGAGSGGLDLTGYTFQVTTASPSTTFTLRTDEAVSYDVDWGDGDADAGVTSNAFPHTYAAAGTYTVTVESVASWALRHLDVAPDDLLVSAVIGAPSDFPWATGILDAWRGCANITEFPAINLSNVDLLARCWFGCTGIITFGDCDISNATTLKNAWDGCSSMVDFSVTSDLSGVTVLREAWLNCSSLTAFPALTFGSVIDCNATWSGCSSLTSFPLLDLDLCRYFINAWRNNSSLVNFPAGFFDTWNPSSVTDRCFQGSWDGCTSLSATSVENIFNSLDASGVSTTIANNNIDVDYDAATGTPSIATAVANLKSRGWKPTLNGVVL